MTIIVYVTVKDELNSSKSKGERTSTIKAKAPQNQKEKDDETVVKDVNTIIDWSFKGVDITKLCERSEGS